MALTPVASLPSDTPAVQPRPTYCRNSLVTAVARVCSLRARGRPSLAVDTGSDRHLSRYGGGESNGEPHEPSRRQKCPNLVWGEDRHSIRDMVMFGKVRRRRCRSWRSVVPARFRRPTHGRQRKRARNCSKNLV